MTHEELEAKFRGLLQRDPFSAFAHRELLKIYLDSNQPDKAISEIKKLFELKSGTEKDKIVLLKLLFKTRKFDECIETLLWIKDQKDPEIAALLEEVEKGLSFAKPDLEVCECLQRIYEIIGQPEKEIMLLEILWEKTKKVKYRQRLSECYIDTKQFAKAAAELEKLKIEPTGEGLRTLINIASCQIKSGFTEKGLDKLDEIDPEAFKMDKKEKVELLYRIGKIYEKNKRPGKALSYYKKILLIDFAYKDVNQKVKTLKRAAEEKQKEQTSSKKFDIKELLPDEYKKIEFLGKGGMGTVYKAFDTINRQDVAIKVLSNFSAENNEAVIRFLQEARATIKMNHNNIVKVYRVEKSNPPYIVLEFVKGKSLRQLLDSEGKMPIGKIKLLARQVALALNHAHQLGIIHRDIKPDNIMLNDRGDAKLMDFGLAQAQDSLKVGKSDEVIGTPYYMSPEQCQGTEVDNRTDIYSFGVLLYELVTGSPPFTEGDIYYQHINKDPVRPSKINPDVPAYIEDIIMKCLEKEAKLRYQGFEEILNDLRLEKKFDYKYQGTGLGTGKSKTVIATVGKISNLQTPIPVFLKQKEGKYQNAREMGEDLFFNIYSAYDLELGKQVRLKFLKPGIFIEDRERERFLQLVHPLTGLIYPGIFQIYDIQEDKGLVVVVTEEFAGQPLDKVIAREGRWPLETIKDVLLQISNGLKRGHSLNISHGGIISKDVLVNNEKLIKIDNFGFHLLSSLIDRHKNEKKKPGFWKYLPEEPDMVRDTPELFDIFSLSVLAAELVAGEVLPDDLEITGRAEYIKKKLASVSEFNALNSLVEKGIDPAGVKDLQLDEFRKVLSQKQYPGSQKKETAEPTKIIKKRPVRKKDEIEEKTSRASLYGTLKRLLLCIGLWIVLIAVVAVRHSELFFPPDNKSIKDLIIPHPIYPNTPHFYYGLNFFNQGYYEAALSQFLTARQDEPENLEIYYRLAGTYEKLGNIDKAIENYEYLVSKGKEEFLHLKPLYLTKARELIKNNEYKNAIFWLKKAQAGAVDDPEIASELALAYYKFGNQLLNENSFLDATRNYYNALEMGSKNPDVHLKLAKCFYQHLDEKKKALHHFRKYLEMKKDKEQVIYDTIEKIEKELNLRR